MGFQVIKGQSASLPAASAPYAGYPTRPTVQCTRVFVLTPSQPHSISRAVQGRSLSLMHYYYYCCCCYVVHDRYDRASSWGDEPQPAAHASAAPTNSSESRWLGLGLGLGVGVGVGVGVG